MDTNVDWWATPSPGALSNTLNWKKKTIRQKIEGSFFGESTGYNQVLLTSTGFYGVLLVLAMKWSTTIPPKTGGEGLGNDVINGEEVGGAKGEGEFEGSGRGFKMTSSTRRRAEPRGEGELEGSGRGFKMTSSTRSVKDVALGRT